MSSASSKPGQRDLRLRCHSFLLKESLAVLPSAFRHTVGRCLPGTMSVRLCCRSRQARHRSRPMVPLQVVNQPNSILNSRVYDPALLPKYGPGTTQRVHPKLFAGSGKAKERKRVELVLAK